MALKTFFKLKQVRSNGPINHSRLGLKSRASKKIRRDSARRAPAEIRSQDTLQGSSIGTSEASNARGSYCYQREQRILDKNRQNALKKPQFDLN